MSTTSTPQRTPVDVTPDDDDGHLYEVRTLTHHYLLDGGRVRVLAAAAAPVPGASTGEWLDAWARGLTLTVAGLSRPRLGLPWLYTAASADGSYQGADLPGGPVVAIEQIETPMSSALATESATGVAVGLVTVIETTSETYLLDASAGRPPVTRYARRPVWASDVDGVALEVVDAPEAQEGQRWTVVVRMPDGRRVGRRSGGSVVAVRTVRPA